MQIRLMRNMRGLLLLLCAGSGAVLAQRPAYLLGEGPWDYRTYEDDTAIRVSVVARDLVHPWSMAFLPGTATPVNALGDVLITEREGRVRLLRNGVLQAEPVADLSALSIDVIFDLALHPQFAANGFVYLSYMKQAPHPDGSDTYWATTALARGRFDGNRVTDLRDIFVADAWSVNRGSDASRLVFGPDGTLYFSSSHRRDTEAPQTPASHVGKVLRLNDDGSAAAGNPYAANGSGLPEVFSIGHRTVLGLTVHPLTGEIWEAENGPQGGDEVNILRAGNNYGWPLATHGRDYDGTRFTEPTLPGTQPPELFWTPSITVSGMTFYSGSRFPAWQNNLFVGAMTTGRIAGTGHVQRIVFNAQGELRREQLLNDLHQRVRDIREGPDGLLYLLTDENAGAMLRIEPLVGEGNFVTSDRVVAAPTAAEPALFPDFDCAACHRMNVATIGPAWMAIADEYSATEVNIARLAAKIIEGGEGAWGEVPMPPHPAIGRELALQMAGTILELAATPAAMP